MLIVLQFWSCGVAAAQRFPGEDRWKHIVDHEGVTFRYLYYGRADGANPGVVLMLENANDYAVSYAFKIVFRSGDEESVHAAKGMLKPGQRKTGGSDGLFWVPWKDGRIIEMVGLRGYTVKPRNKAALDRAPAFFLI